MRGPKCGYVVIASAIERTMAAVQALASDFRGPPNQSAELRACLAEMNLSLHEMRKHLDSCEECEQP